MLIIGFVPILIRRVPHVELTLPQHLSSPVIILLISGVRVVHADTCLHVFICLVPCCDVRYDVRLKRCSISCVLNPIGIVGSSRFIIVFIYVFWCPRFLYQMMFVSFNSNTAGDTCGSGTANPYETHECTPVLVGFVFLDLHFSV